MLYQLHEWHRKLLTPISAWAQATSQLFSNPYSPLSYTVYSRRLAASYDLLYRLGKHYEKPAFNITSVMVDGTEVPVQEHVASTKPFCRPDDLPRGLGAGEGVPICRIIRLISRCVAAGVINLFKTEGR